MWQIYTTEVWLLGLPLILRIALGQEKIAIFENTAAFLFFDVNIDFENAKQLCVNNNATLARISNQDEFDFIVQEFSVGLNLGTTDNFWIGNQCHCFINGFFSYLTSSFFQV